MNGGTVRGEEKHKLARRSKREVCRRFRRVPVPPALTLSSVHKVDRQPSRSVTLLLGTNRRLSRGLRDGAAVPTNKFTFRSTPPVLLSNADGLEWKCSKSAL